MEFKVKAGRFLFDKETNKVKVSKDKGLIHVLKNEDHETHFKWANTETHQQTIDLIVFQGDAVFEPVVGKNNTFVLRFEMDEDRYFFWLQEKVQPEVVVKQINRIICLEDQEQVQSQMVPEQKEVPKPETRRNVNPAPVQAPSKVVDPAKLADMIRQLGKQHGVKQNITALTHLSEVITHDSISKVIANFNEEQKMKLLEYMPEEMRNAKFVNSNLRSPQFLQALDVLSDALNSQNAIPLFMELGLNQKHLQEHYGVEAFLLALMEWAKKEEQR